MVNDRLRQGALRFKYNDEGEFLSSSEKSVPLLIDLPKLLFASNKIIDNSEISKDLQLLLDPGSSLGGARPKASVIDENGNLCIAKFPQKNDEISVVLWEAVALTLAKRSGIEVPDWRVEKGALIVKRFDRIGKKRIPFLSAMSMLGAVDNDNRSYLEIVDSIIQFGCAPKRDMHELWRRIIFSILIMNTDDHLRNHAFLYKMGRGWILSPVYDINPSYYKKGFLSLCVSEVDNTASVELALSVIKYFQLSLVEARKILSEVQFGIKNWQEVAKSFGIKNKEIQQMHEVITI